MPPWVIPLLAGSSGIITALVAAFFARSKDRRDSAQSDRKLSWQEIQDVLDLKDQERDYWHAQALEARAANDDCERERGRLWRIVEGRWGGRADD